MPKCDEEGTGSAKQMPCQPDSLGSDFYSETAKLFIDGGPIGVWSELGNAE